MMQRHSVLIVDDEALVRTLLRTNLEQSGYDVSEAASGKEALARLREQPVDVVLLDLVMPELDGFHVLGEMKQDNLLRNIPVVVVSASEDMESVARCLAMGAVDHLSKPVDAALLHARIRSGLAQRRLREEEERRRVEGAPTVSAETAEEAEPEPEGGMGLAGLAGAILRMGRPHARRSATVGALLLGSMAIYAALPLGFKYITDYALIPGDLGALILILGVLLVATVVEAVLEMGRDWFWAGLVARMLTDLRFGMYRQLQRFSAGNYARTPSGEIIARFTTDLSSVEETLVQTVPQLLASAVFFLFSVTILFTIEPSLALVAILSLYLSFKVGQRLEPPTSAASWKAKAAQAEITSVVQDAVRTQAVVRMYRLQGMTVEDFKHRMLRFLRVSSRSSFLLYLSNLVPSRTVDAFGLLVLGLGALMTLGDYLTLGDLIAFQLVFSELIGTVGELIWGVPHLLQASVGMNRIQQLLDQEPDVLDAPGAVSLAPFRETVSLRDVRFGYAPTHLALDGVTMTVHRGQCALVVGPSGCGKSTVVSLLTRLYDPLSGTVTVDGLDVRTVTQDSLRAQMGVVLQENVLLTGTIRDNIRLGRRDATDAEVEAAARVAEAHELILAMPSGYDTRVGGAGGELSAGQRQRIAIARAVLADPAILLLDEATSALDPASAASINESLRRICQGRTVISVTHRLEDAPRADLVFTFQEGRLVEWGHHEELVVRGGPYTALWKKQTGFEISTDGSRATVEPQRLRAIPLLNGLDDAALEQVARLFATEHLGPDRTVVQQGDPGDRFYLIVRGKAAVSRRTADGAERRLAVLEDGDHFGEVALLRQVPRTATVRTLSDSIFLSLAGDQFLRLVEANPELRQALERTVEERALN